MSELLWLDDPRARDTSRVGPKLARLAELGAHGVRVPQGFALCAPIHARALEGVGEACAELGRRLGEDEPRVAVRSSALFEDGAEHSHAGELLTVLGARGEVSIRAAIERCFEALARTAAPRASLAIGVLALVPARASGVAFSRHPHAARSDRVLIESSFGLGPAIVEGQVDPDRVELDRDGLRVLRHVVAHKARWTALGDAGEARLAPMPEALQRASSISAPEAVRLAAQVLAIESRLGFAVDVEWVVHDYDHEARITVVQARPITGARAASPPRWDPVRYALRYGATGAR